MARYGYMKLDAREQDVSRQALLLDPIEQIDRIFVDQSTQSKNAREQRQKMLAQLTSGDLVYVAAVDRFCDNTRDFLVAADKILRCGANLILLQENIDTRSAAGRQALRFLKSFAEIDYSWQSQRKKSGIQAARNQGRRIGRPPVSVPPGFRTICQDWSEGRINGLEAARRSGLKSTSFYKKANELGFKAASRIAKKPNGGTDLVD